MIFPEIVDGLGNSLCVKCSESRAVIVLPHNEIQQEGLNNSSAFGAKSKLLSPRARWGSDNRMRWVTGPEAARQELGTEKVELSRNWKDLSYLVEILPCGR